MKRIDPKTASPKEYLEYLRSIQPTFQYPDNIDQSVVLSELAKRSPKFSKSLGKGPPKAMSMQEVIDGLFAELGSTLRTQKNRVRLQDVAVGELRRLEANACSVKVPAGGYVILVNSGLMLLIHKLTKAFVSLLEIQDLVKKKKTNLVGVRALNNVHTVEQTALHVYSNVATYLLFNAPIGPRLSIASLSYHQTNFAGALLHFAELFVVAHEFGHILKGHFSEASTINIKTNEGDVVVFDNDWNQEYSADLCGLQLVQETLENYEDRYKKPESIVYASGYAGPDLLLTMFDLIEKVGKKKTTTHPPASLRRTNLRSTSNINKIGLVLAEKFELIENNMWALLNK